MRGSDVVRRLLVGALVGALAGVLLYPAALLAAYAVGLADPCSGPPGYLVVCSTQQLYWDDVGTGAALGAVLGLLVRTVARSRR